MKKKSQLNKYFVNGLYNTCFVPHQGLLLILHFVCCSQLTQTGQRICLIWHSDLIQTREADALTINKHQDLILTSQARTPMLTCTSYILTNKPATQQLQTLHCTELCEWAGSCYPSAQPQQSVPSQVIFPIELEKWMKHLQSLEILCILGSIHISLSELTQPINPSIYQSSLTLLQYTNHCTTNDL